MAVRAEIDSATGLGTMLARWAEEEALAGIRFFRALHWRQTPYPRLHGPRLAVWLARKIGVYAENDWIKDPDWEPLSYTWNEDDLSGQT